MTTSRPAGGWSKAPESLVPPFPGVTRGRPPPISEADRQSVAFAVEEKANMTLVAARTCLISEAARRFVTHTTEWFLLGKQTTAHRLLSHA